MANEKEVNRGPVRVEVVGVQIPFYDLIVLIMKFVIAAIPALFLLATLGFIIALILAIVFEGRPSY
jgi:hypothetical protein